MESGFAILMLCFSGALLLYAGILALTRDPKMISRHYASEMENPRAYAAKFAKIMALVALAPAASGITALVCGPDSIYPVRVLIGGVVLAITVGVYMMKKRND